MSQPWTPENPVNAHVKEICFKVKESIEVILKTAFGIYIPLTYRSQVVDGTYYLIKVDIGGDVCVHAMVFETGELTVNGAKYSKNRDPLVPF